MKKLHLILLVIAVLMLSLMVLVPAAQAGTLYVGQADLYGDGSLFSGTPWANDLLVVTLNGSVLTQSTRGMFPGGSRMNWTYRWVASGNEWVLISSWGIVKYNGLPPAVRITVL